MKLQHTGKIYHEKSDQRHCNNSRASNLHLVQGWFFLVSLFSLIFASPASTAFNFLIAAWKTETSAVSTEEVDTSELRVFVFSADSNSSNTSRAT